jgi:hypothetical protein
VKEKEAFVDYRDHQMAMYVEKDDGTYGVMKTGSFMTKNYFDDYQEKIRKWDTLHFERLINGEYSPVAYYMALLDMTPAEMAVRTGTRIGVVRKYMDPLRFGTMTINEARRYADVFNITLAELFLVPEPGSKAVRFNTTQNPWIVLASDGKGEMK